MTEKPAFKDAIERRRCLVPADAFYEWKKTSNGTKIVRRPFLIRMKNDEAFAFAGIWDRWKSPEGKMVLSVSILTTDANPLVRDVHDRMPVIVPREHYDVWLDPKFRDVQALEEIMKPFAAAEMEKLAVSDRVNSVKNDDPECASPAADEPGAAKTPEPPRQTSLF